MVSENADIHNIYIGTSISRVDNCSTASRIDWTITGFVNFLVLGGLLVLVAKNRSLVLSNYEIHDKNMHLNHNLHLSSTNLTLVQKGVLYSGS